MKSSLILIALASILVSFCAGEQWALLVAGSNSYGNYRHQADICHAYHVLHKHGIPDERIVVMMYDDIAHNEENPFPGNIINKPNGPNVYPGVLKDYTRDEVTPEVFLKVLSGDAEGVERTLGRKGKVIKSGPNDHVFVNFADHGGPYLLGFPNDVLHAGDLNKVILKMHKNRQYKEMVFYVEACESGSMFDGLLRKDINVYATTASNPTESSYATYFDKKRNTYLGDVYSVKWMEDSDVENLSQETLKHQFELVKKETNTSHVCQYGDVSISNQKVGAFQGEKSTRNNDVKPLRGNKSGIDANLGAIPSEQVMIETLRRRLQVAEGKLKWTLQQKYRALLRRNKETFDFFRSVAQFAAPSKQFYEVVQEHRPVTDFVCYEEGVRMIQTMCPGMNLPQNDKALRSLRALANLCEYNIPKERVWGAISIAAAQNPMC